MKIPELVTWPQVLPNLPVELPSMGLSCFADRNGQDGPEVRSTASALRVMEHGIRSGLTAFLLKKQQICF